MGTRRKARELAMQALFFMDSRRDFSEVSLERFCASFSPKPDERLFFLRLVGGVLRSRELLDSLIERHSENWTLGRMSGVDRNVMRVAVYELLCCRDIPAKVSINEAVDIGKKFGTEDSGAFINGIVDSIRAAAEAGELELGSLECLPDDAPAGAAAPSAPDAGADLGTPSAAGGLPEPETAPEPGRRRPRKAKARSAFPVLRRKRKAEPSAEE
jgi:N utilization substance protein B